LLVHEIQGAAWGYGRELFEIPFAEAHHFGQGNDAFEGALVVVEDAVSSPHVELEDAPDGVEVTPDGFDGRA